MARITIEGDTIAIHLSLWDKLLAVHGSLHLPLAHVKSVSTEPVKTGWFMPFKLMGSHLPGVITAGTFATQQGYVFYDVTSGEHCISLDVEHEFYKKVVIQVDNEHDLQEIAGAIRAALPH